MKRVYTIFVGIFIISSIIAQIPQKLSYQAVIRNNSNQLVVNQAVGMQVSILLGSSEGTAVYVETQTPGTNANGLVSIEIGGGTPVTGTFENIDWSTGVYFIKTETDLTGGTNYTITGTSQLLSVPYALYSKSAQTASDAATKRYVDSLKQQFELLKHRLYIEFPELNDPKVLSEQVITSGKTGAFGGSISVSGNLAVVGAGWENTEQANKAGAVYVYEYDGSQWVEKQRITNPNGTYDAIFGYSVATNGTYIVITEPNTQTAYIYSKSGSNWVLEESFTVTDVSSEKFGVSCDIYDKTVIIGSSSVFATYCNAVGSVYVYEKNNAEWSNTAILTPSDGLAHDCFGMSVSVYGATIAVGACRASCYVSEQGYVCIFEKNGTDWIETQRIVAPEGTGERFGQGIDMENNKLVITCATGVYYYEKGETWGFIQKITSPNPSGNDSFGFPVSISNNYLLIGAYTDSELFTSQGAAYIYEYEGTSWNEKLKIIPSDTKENDGFGLVVFLNNNNAFVSGGPSKDKISNVYIYTLY